MTAPEHNYTNYNVLDIFKMTKIYIILVIFQSNDSIQIRVKFILPNECRLHVFRKPQSAAKRQSVVGGEREGWWDDFFSSVHHH